MLLGKRDLKGLWVSDIRDMQECRRYVGRTTALSASVALCLDVANQLVFFSDWQTALRSWIMTILISGGIAFVASRSIGRAQLAMWQAKAEFERLSRTDPLTGLLNRRALLTGQDVPDAVTLVIADIDRFKMVNDTHGHLTGDEVIRTVSRLLAEHLGDLGRVGRLGGEEFAFTSSDVPLSLLMQRLEGFRAAVAAKAIVIEGSHVSITVSGGVAVRREGQSFEALYAAADRALYAAKTSGRNRILVDLTGDGRDVEGHARNVALRTAA